MEKDRSLDDFLGGRDATGGSKTGTSETDVADAAPAETTESDDATVEMAEADDATVTPATPTYRWLPNGDSCPKCGETVERGWFDDGQFVCADCKEW